MINTETMIRTNKFFTEYIFYEIIFADHAGFGKKKHQAIEMKTNKTNRS